MVTHLDTLPAEILFNILSFTEPTLNPTLVSYPLNALAETSKQLNAVVEEYARSLLKQHANITPPKNARTFTCRRKWLFELCQFCRKASKRKACFYSTLTCCKDCDRKEFPKMTMTEATQSTHLSKLDLFTPSPLHPLRPLATGTYPVNGGTATMLSTPDVHARRDLIYGLLGDKVKDEKYMRLRPARHDRITKHMHMDLHNGRWYNIGNWEIKEGKGLPKSMQSREARGEYIKKALEREREDMGMELERKLGPDARVRPCEKGSVVMAVQCGASRERAIELD